MRTPTAKGGFFASLRQIRGATLIAAAGAGLALYLLVLSLGDGTGADQLKTWALLVLAISLFATHVLPEHVTALTVFLLALLGDIAPADVVFSGFEVGALWLLFSGIIIGAAAQEAGLGAFIARRILSLWRMTYTRAVVLLIVIALVLGLIVPATIPRIILLMPVALGLAEAMGFEEGGKGYTGLALAAGLGTFLPTFAVVTANLPAVVHVGVIESVYGIKVSYAEFLIYQLPAVGILRAVVLMALLLLLFSQPGQPVTETSRERMTLRQFRLSIVLFGAIIFWATDVFHGIHPAWIAMAAAVVILWPSSRLISPTAFREKIDLAPVLYVASLLSIGAIMINNGLDAELGDFILGFVSFSPDSQLINLYLLTVLSQLVCLISTTPAAPILLVPIAGELGQASEIPLMGVLMAQLVGFSSALLPYQAPPLIVLLSLCKVRFRDVVKVIMLVALATLFLGVPVAYLWWGSLGLL
ncbi:SLC13 family permease [Dichotomicrobium thermohalophilum]|uniref:Di/tricarboxylate transporter n=1 Tax=Dichotomicrobium thermohalophilum TaxID=933063 RepID=A0A397QDA4_9HYPH|nr:SLC13 family permease [Dichotomicrobium thermohalophilum]RIA56241.1 di/tricarboxylate transporter [Dichotomicrobium thermohalophilum]